MTAKKKTMTTGKEEIKKLKLKRETIRDLQVKSKVKGGQVGYTKVNCGTSLARYQVC